MAEVGPLFVPIGQSNNPWRDASRHRQPCELTLAGGSPFFERCIAADRLGASRHRRTRALKRHASAQTSSPKLHCSYHVNCDDGSSFLTSPRCLADAEVHSLCLDRIIVFFRHHGLGGLCALPSRQYNLIHERPEIVLRDGNTACVHHTML